MAPRTLAALVSALGQAALARPARRQTVQESDGNPSDCLPDAIPVQLRTKGIGVNGDWRPLGIWTLEWPSGRIVAEMIHILAHEKLGYHVRTHGGGGTDSHEGFFAVAGCTSPKTGSGCGGAASDWHLVLEVWEEERSEASISSFREEYPDIAPGSHGSIGYPGMERLYILGSQRTAAWEAEGLPLDWHRSYNRTWHTPEVYFDRPTAFQSLDSQLDLFQPCWQTEMDDPGLMEDFLKYSGDEDGVVNDTGGRLRAKCWNQSWWYSPSCRDNVSGCVFTLSLGSGWGVAEFMQKAVYYGMPLGIAVARNESTYKELARQHAAAFYWWEPDTTFIDLAAYPVVFELHDPKAWAAGDARTSRRQIELAKYCWYDLHFAAPDVHALMAAVSISTALIKEMLLNLTETGDSPMAVACTFLRQHREIWTSWVSSRTDCIEGQGMIDEETIYVDERKLAIDCAWCPRGFHSERILDDRGYTNVCRPCPPGSYQPLPGESECLACPPGTYIDSAGSTECALCEVGKYQAEPNMSACVECDSPKSTVLFGAALASDCVCPATMYQQLSGECASCGRGLECVVDTKEANIPPGPGRTAASCDGSTQCNFPVPSPGYYTTYSEPLSVYFCIDEASCPGNAIESCGTMMTGLVCAICEDGYFRDGDACLKCQLYHQSWFRSWVLPALLLVPGVLLLYRISGDDVEQWSGPGKRFSIVLYTFLAYCQTIALVLETRANLPRLWVDSVSWATHFYDYTQLLRDDCWFDFGASFTQRIARPAAVALVFVATYGASVLLARQGQRPWMHLSKDRLFNCYGTLGFAFYITIVSNAMYWFRCYKHPNGASSLLMSPEILCHSDFWIKYLGLAICAVLVFCVASLALVSWVLYVAPRRFQEVTFRRRWKFLLLKFRPSAWWWGLVVLCKGLWINLTTVLWHGGFMQIIWILSGVLSYAGATYFFLPWRFYSASCLDAFQSCFLVVFLTFSTNFVAASDRTVQEMYWGIQVILSVPVVSSCGIGARLILLRWREARYKAETKHMSELELKEMCEVFCLMGSPKGWPDLVAALRTMSDADVRVLIEARGIITTQLVPGGEREEGHRSCSLNLAEAAAVMFPSLKRMLTAPILRIVSPAQRSDDALAQVIAVEPRSLGPNAELDSFAEQSISCPGSDHNEGGETLHSQRGERLETRRRVTMDL